MLNNLAERASDKTAEGENERSRWKDGRNFSTSEIFDITNFRLKSIFFGKIFSTTFLLKNNRDFHNKSLVDFSDLT